MRVLHVSASDLKGGAAIGAHRLVVAQRAAGIDARMLVVEKCGTDEFVEQLRGPLLATRIQLTRAVGKRVGALLAHDQPRAMRSFGLLRTGLGSAIRDRSPDIVQWHWVGGEAAGLADLAAPSVPAIWTCRDHWIGAGAEHFPLGDDHLQGYAGRRWFDPDRWAYAAKRRALATWKPHLVCLSDWSARELSRVPHLAGLPLDVIPNTLDFDDFHPIDRSEARSSLGLEPHRDVLLFGAQGGVSDDRKGFAVLQTALERLPERNRSRLTLLTFGGAQARRDELGGIPLIELGPLKQPGDFRMAYCAASVFANPSLAETFGNTTLEALACGTACVAFAVGGAPEMIDRAIMGRLAMPGDHDAFAGGLAAQLSTSDDEPLRQDRHRRVKELFCPRRVAEAYRALYARILEGTGKGGCNS